MRVWKLFWNCPSKASSQSNLALCVPLCLGMGRKEGEDDAEEESGGGGVGRGGCCGCMLDKKLLSLLRGGRPHDFSRHALASRILSTVLETLLRLCMCVYVCVYVCTFVSMHFPLRRPFLFILTWMAEGKEDSKVESAAV